MTRVNVLDAGDTVQVLNGATGSLIEEYPVVELAKSEMAWDVVDPGGDTKRLVAQAGCGCGGMKVYEVDSSYRGSLGIRGEKL